MLRKLRNVSEEQNDYRAAMVECCKQARGKGAGSEFCGYG